MSEPNIFITVIIVIIIILSIYWYFQRKNEEKKAKSIVSKFVVNDMANIVSNLHPNKFCSLFYSKDQQNCTNLLLALKPLFREVNKYTSANSIDEQSLHIVGTIATIPRVINAIIKFDPDDISKVLLKLRNINDYGEGFPPLLTKVLNSMMFQERINLVTNTLPDFGKWSVNFLKSLSINSNLPEYNQAI